MRKTQSQIEVCKKIEAHANSSESPLTLTAEEVWSLATILEVQSTEILNRELWIENALGKLEPISRNRYISATQIKEVIRILKG